MGPFLEHKMAKKRCVSTIVDMLTREGAGAKEILGAWLSGCVHEVCLFDFFWCFSRNPIVRVTTLVCSWWFLVWIFSSLSPRLSWIRWILRPYHFGEGLEDMGRVAYTLYQHCPTGYEDYNEKPISSLVVCDTTSLSPVFSAPNWLWTNPLVAWCKSHTYPCQQKAKANGLTKGCQIQRTFTVGGRMWLLNAKTETLGNGLESLWKCSRRLTHQITNAI